VKEIVLQPTLPAKGSGLIEIFWESERKMYPGGFIHATDYTERIHSWLAERAQKLEAMIGCKLGFPEKLHFHGLPRIVLLSFFRSGGIAGGRLPSW